MKTPKGNASKKEKKEKANTLTGTIDQVRFQRDEFVILVVSPSESRGTIACLGNMISPTIGLEYTFYGQKSDGGKWGPQFKFSSYKTNEPVDPAGIVRYLIKTCRWIGSATSSKIVDEFGTETLKILKTNPSLVAQKIKGITLDRANEIQEALNENEALETVMIELEGMLNVPGVRKVIIPELVRVYGGAAAEKLRQNFYMLTEYHGTGFVLADKVAMKNGVARDDIQRQKAAILYIIDEGMASAGHVWFPDKQLRTEVETLISVSVYEGFKALQGEGLIITRDGLCALKKAADREQTIGRILNELVAIDVSGQEATNAE